VALESLVPLTQSGFATLGLAEPLLRALEAAEFVTPTPIQARAIPPLLEGRDLFGIAQTGTGKTAAFALPILHRLASEPRPSYAGVRALILAPTRELAVQIFNDLKRYRGTLPIRLAAIFGGVGQVPQVEALKRGVDIVVATPGRLLDLQEQGHVRLGRASVLVLDEADRMLDMGFLPAIRRVVQALPKVRQTMLFSATMPPPIAKLAADLLRDPLRIEVTPAATPVERIEQRVHFVEQPHKPGLLAKLLTDPSLERVIVFTRTKHGANRVVEQLGKSGTRADAIHGNKSQSARQKALESFRNGKVRVLVATDIASRGIDVAGITHVVNYELPNEPENYVHRIGRTARAGASGAAISFCASGERAFLRDIERLTKVKLSVIGDIPPAIREPAPNARPPQRKQQSNQRHRSPQRQPSRPAA